MKPASAIAVASIFLFSGCGGATPKPDLTPHPGGGSGFGITSVQAGDAWSCNVSIENSGGADAGRFETTVYASLDTSITAADYVIGSVVTVSLTSGNWVTENLSVSSFPSIPANTYYVGWIIDSLNEVAETSETNNKAYVLSPQLTVNP